MSRNQGSVILCGILCGVFAALAWTAAAGKSATWDEPSHAATGWLMLWRHDYRISPDVPPLWEYWVSLLNGPDALHFNASAKGYRELHSKIDLFKWVVRTLYHTTGNDGVALVTRGREMSLVLGVALAILIARWAWQLAGPIAAVAACFLYCFDPNFLGHAPLVKNDVAFALIYFAAAYAMWRLGRRFTWLSVSVLALLTAAAVAIKLSGVLMAPVLVVALLLRALLPQTWLIFGKSIARRGPKLAAALGACALAAVVTYIGLWASYGFHFDAGPDGLTSDTNYFVRELQRAQLLAQYNRQPTDAESAAWQMPLSTQIVLSIEKHRLLPQAWTAGFVLTQMGDELRGAFLNNTSYVGGRWYYFPLAALYKSPLATLAALLLSVFVAHSALTKGLLRNPEHEWSAIALAIPFMVYAAILLTSNLNIGLRHAFPLFPFVFVAVSLAAAQAWEAGSPKPGEASGGRIAILILGAALAAETAAAFPNYIAFFNIAAASHRLELLSDSNLDWGQDLPLLARWQAANPDTTLYLDYFGLCDPAAYGIHYVNVGQGYVFGPPPVLPAAPGVVAVSATNLQQVYGEDAMAELFAASSPGAILGDTIYLFKFDPADFTGPATRP